MTEASSAPPAPQTPLAERLKTMIAQRGPISIADYMADALFHAQEGYYMTQVPVGKAGDFTTAPEISQIFGELIGLWLVQSWSDMGAPDDFHLIELGPGRGTLMRDILRVAHLRPAFLKAARLWLVEISGRLRHEQQKTLKSMGDVDIQWADRLEDIPEAPCLIIANEFFDCFPIRQFQFDDNEWRERLVGLDEAGNLTFVCGPDAGKLDHPLIRDGNAVSGDIIEISEQIDPMIAEIAKHLQAENGRALIFDYGHYSHGKGDTLQAVYQHKFWPVLQHPGIADITAHVDFQSLGELALRHGCSVYGPQAQGRFLDRLGLAMRVEALCNGKPEAEQNAVKSGADRIAASDKMGELFKTICLSSPDLPPPAGFEGQ